MPTQPSGGSPRIETLSEDVADRSASYLRGRVVGRPRAESKTAATIQVEAAWREALEPTVSAVLGDEDWGAVNQVWQPEHCGWLEAVAEALDEAWASTVPMSSQTRLALRLVGLPPVVAAFVLEIVDRSLITAREPVAAMAELFRSVGTVLCPGTANALACSRLRREIDAVPKVPDYGLLVRLEGGFRRALNGPTSATIKGFLLGLDTKPTPLGAEAEPTVDTPSGPIGRSLVVTGGAVDAPAHVATFGES